MNDEPSLQERLFPDSMCFGCGHANPHGLRIRSFPHGDQVITEWKAEPHHVARAGIVCGGILGAILDCHSAITAIWAFMQRDGLSAPPDLVTKEYTIRLLRPTPIDSLIRVVAKVTKLGEREALVEAQSEAEQKVRTTCSGTFVIVRPR